MIILSNCMMDTADEGCVKVANSLVKRIKAKTDSASVVSYERFSALTDIRLKLNKFFLNPSLWKLLRNYRDESVLYIPFPAKPIAMAIRLFVLSCFCRGRLRVLQTMNVPMGPAEKLLYKLSKATIYVLSHDSEKMLRNTVGTDRVIRLKLGVDTQKFTPVTPEEKRSLKIAHGFDPNAPLVLHVGHLNQGRNVGQLLKLNSQYQVLLVTSTLTKDEQDLSLRDQLLHRNIRIVSDFIPRIQEIYQMADAYFFPVQELGRCIDAPLSCLEAAACNISIITTDFGEMKAFQGMDGFHYLESFEAEYLNSTIEHAINSQPVQTRNAVMEYDWDLAIKTITAFSD